MWTREKRRCRQAEGKADKSMRRERGDLLFFCEVKIICEFMSCDMGIIDKKGSAV